MRAPQQHGTVRCACLSDETGFSPPRTPAGSGPKENACARARFLEAVLIKAGDCWQGKS